jgi:hypothetical protein
VPQILIEHFVTKIHNGFPSVLLGNWGSEIETATDDRTLGTNVG